MVKRPGSATDPLWYKDAVIYELHVRAFMDSNNDGIGDFQGLVQKLEYLQDLGVTCLWLLPFFPSPLRDDGYDIADYLDVHPNYGTLEDFQAFLQAAHERGLQVVIELVVNHTSDQHPWFQRARQAPPGSPERDFYVWSDTDQKYREVRIIFTDTEKSNWTWDPVAKAYYWHRFFSHQPDLNYDNPLVVEEIVKVMHHWLDLGVDGLRLDAIPYLIERDGTNCENLPETHVLIKAIRQEMDRRYANRMILAEANQWPTDVRPYFGEGDECHMAFHFPLMPRIFIGLRLEDRAPIVDIMAQTPPIPDTCQWALFLRNHDELTLEMVTADERDYMYFAYSADPQMRLNLGIRRRLSPLLDHNRHRIELLNSLLLSLPGTPVIYYGDEIGMGDNIYLGDRNGVRTPMQWNADRNAGFSRVTPGRLFSPVIMDPIYGYEAVNVEAQQSDPSSLLNWTRNMIALRKLFRVFGRGTLEFLHPANSKVLAYVRRYEGEQVLCVANLSRFAQPVELDLSAYADMLPVEMLGYVEFPMIRREPYRLTLGPYGFMWFEFHGDPQAVAARASLTLEAELPLDASRGWEGLFDGFQRERLERGLLPRFLSGQRWFGAKTRKIAEARLEDWGPLADSGAVLALIRVVFEEGDPEDYALPLAMSFAEAADAVLATPAVVVAGVTAGDRVGVLYDALSDDHACLTLLSCIESAAGVPTHQGLMRGTPGAAFAAVRGPEHEPLPLHRSPGEQSNTSVVYGDRLILKLFRRHQAGVNPDCEIGRFLTERAGFDHVPPFAGSLEYHRDGATATLGLLQGLVASEGDGWSGALDELYRYYEAWVPKPFPTQAPDPREYVGIYLDAAATLGRRTAQLHLALAAGTDEPAFSPEPLTADHLARLVADFGDRAVRTLEHLKDNLPRLPDEAVEEAGLVLRRRRDLLGRLQHLAPGMGGQRIRVHGDYHLGQVLRVKNDYVIFDFEGAPARPLDERRAKHSPLKDVASMLRSFSYATYAALVGYAARRPEAVGQLEPWARLWERSTSMEFLRAYRETVAPGRLLPESPVAADALLQAYLVDKALNELRHELDNRPGWVRIPLWGLSSL